MSGRRPRSWRDDFSLEGEARDGSLTKALLEDIASACPQGTFSDGLAVYRAYLSKSLNLNLSHDVLSKLNDDLLSRFYQSGDSRANPKYLDLMKNRQVARLELAAGVRLILARSPTVTGQTWLRLHDRSVVRAAAGEKVDDGEVPTLFYALDHHLGHWELYRHRGELSQARELLRYADCFAVDWLETPVTPSVTSCFAEKIGELLKSETQAHEHSPRCTTLRGVVASRAEMYRLLGRPVILATHLSSNPKVRRSYQAKDQLFARLAFLRDPAAELPKASECSVVCAKLDGSLYVPLEHFADAARYQAAAARASGPSHPNSEVYPGLWKPRPSPAAAARAAAERKSCCGPCANAPSYAKNLDEGGSQKLFKTPLSTFDCLQMLGLDSEENVAAVRRACRLSCLFYDLECCTSLTKSEAGQEELRSDYASISGESAPGRILATQHPIFAGLVDGMDLEGGREPSILHCSPGGHDSLVRELLEEVLCRREAAVAAKRDLLEGLTRKVSALKEGFYAFFRSEGFLQEEEEERAEFSAFRRCLVEDDTWDCFDDDEADDQLSAWKGEASDEDTPPQPPARKPKRVEVDLAARRRRTDRLQIDSTWKNTLFGRLEANLDALVQNYVAFAYNSEGYDLPIMVPTLSTALKERGFRKISLQLDGSKVRSLSTRGLSFQEVMRLLPAGASLAKFREMVGIAESKQIFPFDLLDQSLDFLSATELPADAAAWTSRVTGGAPEQAEVDSARKKFSEMGFRDVADFLRFYLSNDTLMLAKGFEALRDSYFSLFGLDVIDSRRYSISGLSALAAQAHLFRSKAVGMFSLQDSRMYSLLRQGLRGGLTACYRTAAGKDLDFSDFVRIHREQQGAVAASKSDEELERYLRGINSHRLPPGEMPRHSADYVKYFDVVGLYSYAATRSLPFGTAVLYSAEGRGGDAVLRRDRGGAPAYRSGTGGDESVFCQWLAYEAFPQSTRVCSAWTAGPGQDVTSFGSQRQQKSDALLSMPWVDPATGAAGARLAYFNYDGMAFHRDGDHLPECPLRRGGAPSAENRPPPRKNLTWRDIWPGSKCRQVNNREVLFGREDLGLSLAPQCSEYKDAREDALRVGLAAALTAAASAAGFALQVTFASVHECEFLHDFDNFDAAARLGSSSPRTPGQTPRDVLRDRHGDRSVLGSEWRESFTQDELVAKLMTTKDNHLGGRFGGFLLVVGGRQTCPDDNMGYCHQRVPTRPSEVGSFTRWQAAAMCGGDDAAAWRMLEKYCSSERTVTRKSYAGEGGELLGADLFRWMVRRGFAGYSVRHFVSYTHADFLDGFLEPLLQERHKLKLRGGPSLRGELIKLTVNSCYGHSCMQATNFPKTTVVSEDYLRGKRGDLVKSGRLTKITLLGATDPLRHGPEGFKVRGKTPQLLYAVTRHNRDGRVRNILQMASSILSNSRVVFLGILAHLLSALDPYKAQLAYIDTDSQIWTLSSPNLEDCLLEGVDPRVLDAVMEDPSARAHQGGKLKHEGTFSAALFRSVKCYFLAGGLDGGEMRRLRGVKRKVQADLAADVFGQDATRNQVVVRGTYLRPSQGFQMTVREESKTLAHSLNLERQAVDCVNSVSLP